jgi:hypothetical protein
MTEMRNSKSWRTLTWLVTLALVASLVPLCALPGAAQEAHPQLRTFLVMPTVDTTGAGVDYLSRMVMDQLALALTSQKGLAALEFLPTTPVVQRAVEEGRVLPVQFEAGTTTPAAAIGIAQALGVDAVILTTADSAVATDNPRQVKLVITGSVFSVAPNYNDQTKEVSATPQADRTFKVIGASQTLAGYSGSDRPLFHAAVMDAVGQITALMMGQPAYASYTSRKSNNLNWLAYVAGVALIVLLVANKGTSHAPAGALAPIPVSESIQPGGIQLSWDPPPASTLTLLKYQIQRSTNGGPYQYIDQGLVLAGTTTFFDQNLTTGSYQYRIAAVYTNQAVSPFANFNSVSFTAQ